jgi:DNA (cytosine-5)-methyltransferase 1
MDEYVIPMIEDTIKIPNHYSPKLSDLDMKMVMSIPPGGNWKNIPQQIPSKRLENIRKSFALGKGSRSTYYGRLRPDEPAYTISTCINRPGNGCNIHYDYEGGQHRLISQREAARLQSFPDNFIFFGSKNDINKQIGNAVPPLLAYQIANVLGKTGFFIDLFSGAGGLSLGFKWAGWKPIIANDIEGSFLQTYSYNIHDSVICGDIREKEILEKVISEALPFCNGKKPFIILGGPPCQGFSTAGNSRNVDDERNHLYKSYCRIVSELHPDYFVFENVTGLQNMQNGKIFEQVKNALESVTGKVTFWRINTEEYGIPQRRNRIFFIGSKVIKDVNPPKPLFYTNSSPNTNIKKSITVMDALSDLPPIKAGQDGSNLDYTSEPITSYQKLMRGIVSPMDYLTNNTIQSINHQVELPCSH